MLEQNFPVQVNDGYTMTDTPPIGGLCHGLLEIGWCHEGTGILSIGPRCFEFHPRSVLVMGANQHHFIHSTRGNIAIWTILHIDLQQLLAAHVPVQSPLCVDDLCGPHFQHIMDEKSEAAICKVVSQMVAEVRLRPENWQSNLRALCRTLAVYLQRLPGRHRYTEAQQVAMQAMQAVMETVIRQMSIMHSPEVVARSCDISLQYIAQQCQLAYNCSIEDFIMRLRMGRASDELHHSSLSFADIALATGFDDDQVFSKAFQLHFAATPQEWRRGR